MTSSVSFEALEITRGKKTLVRNTHILHMNDIKRSKLGVLYVKKKRIGTHRLG